MLSIFINFNIIITNLITTCINAKIATTQNKPNKPHKIWRRSGVCGCVCGWTLLRFAEIGHPHTQLKEFWFLLSSYFEVEEG
jgi:hypothetical protein